MADGNTSVVIQKRCLASWFGFPHTCDGFTYKHIQTGMKNFQCGCKTLGKHRSKDISPEQQVNMVVSNASHDGVRQDFTLLVGRSLKMMSFKHHYHHYAQRD